MKNANCKLQNENRTERNEWNVGMMNVGMRELGNEGMTNDE